MQIDEFKESASVPRRLAQQCNRMLAVRMMENNVPAYKIAKACGVTVRSVYRWVDTLKKMGEEGLLARKGAGRPPKVSPTQKSWVALVVKDDTPANWGLGFKLWTLNHVKKVVELGLGLSLSLPTVRNIMREMGFTPQRPLHRAHEQDPALVEQWVKVELLALRRRAEVEGAKLMFGDEASMRTDYHAGTTWAPRGQTPGVESTGNRQVVNMISAVSTAGELQFMLIDGPGNSYTFKDFLEKLVHDSEKPIFLVVDNHSSHKSKLVMDYVKSTKGKLELFYIPPYAPQLNPDEQVWKNVKGKAAKKCPTDKREMRCFLRNAFENLMQTPEIVMGFFRHPDCGFVT